MPAPLLLPLDACSDQALVGGKAAGLGQLMRLGFLVPPGLCLTTLAYRDGLRAAGIDPALDWTSVTLTPESDRLSLLSRYRTEITSLTLPQALLTSLDAALARLEADIKGRPSFGQELLWAVRSSATDEDAPGAAFSGLYRTSLGEPRDAIAAAVLECWASLWAPAAVAYRSRFGQPGDAPSMAVVLQPLLAPLSAGVAFSRHPVTGQQDQVVINAVFGLSEPLVAGLVTPDHYVVEVGNDNSPGLLRERHVAEKTRVRTVTRSGLEDRLVPTAEQWKPVLSDHEVLALARLIKTVERAMGTAVDVEWALDGRDIWLLQARPISITGRPIGTDATCSWSRANFKETLPELPSPLGLSFLDQFMERNILRHYRDLGCRISPGLSPVRLMHGRPYINLTLFQSFTAQLGGNPALITEQMGGEGPAMQALPARLAWWRRLRALLVMEWTIRRAARRAPAWFAEMKRMTEASAESSPTAVSPEDHLARLDRLGQWLHEGDLTFAIVAGVSQGLQVMDALLKPRIGPGWRSRLNAALQGLGTVVSAQPILRLGELAEAARREPAAQAFFLAEPFAPEEFRIRLAGTRLLQMFEGYLHEYGHRATGESDIGSPRFAEQPGDLLAVIRGRVQGPPAAHGKETSRRQENARLAALREIRHAFGWRVPLRMLFRWWYRRLCLFLSLREANRHHLMYFTAEVRRLALLIGERLAARDCLASKEDIVFLTPDEIRAAVTSACRDGANKETGQQWKDLVLARQAERSRHAVRRVPDFVSPAGSVVPAGGPEDLNVLRGIPLSVGTAEGPVRLLLTPEDTAKVRRGEILVVPVIDPGMTPLLALAAGLIAEMGGTLSHGAIIAREYGIPAVANVRHATRLLKDGELVALDAASGQIRRLSPS